MAHRSSSLSSALAGLVLAAGSLMVPSSLFGYAEETPTQGQANQLHSSFHYNLVRALAAASGFGADDAERIARVCEATDVQDFLDVHLAGTERPSIWMGAQSIGLYYHWPRRGVTGSDGSYTFPGSGNNTCDYFLGSNIPESQQAANCPMTVQNDGQPGPCQVDDEGNVSPEVNELESWAIYGEGLPRFGAPTLAIGDADQPKAPVAGGSLEALGVYLHSLADSYSHEACMQQCAFQGHADSPPNCTAFWWHWVAEYGTSNLPSPTPQPNPGVAYTTAAAQAVWQALGVYRGQHGMAEPAPATAEEVGDFISRWVMIDNGPERAAAADAYYDQLTGGGR